MTNKAEQLKEQAREYEAKRDESFERSDTDGFLSQYASGMMAQLRRKQAEIEEAGGYASFRCLIEENTGRRVDAKVIETRYGFTWILSDSEERKFGRKFVPTDDSELSKEERDALLENNGISSSRSRVQANLGLKQSTELVKAYAILAGRGTGLSGSCYVKVLRDKNV